MISNRLKNALAAVGMMLLAAGCTDSRSKTHYDGLWRVVGYAMTLSIKKGRVTTYQSTKDTAILTSALDGTIEHDRLTTPRVSFSLRLQDGKLVLTDRDSGDTYVATKQTEALKLASPEQMRDARYNFDLFWQAFDEHYAFFDLYGVDWGALRQQYASRITPGSSAEDVQAVLQEMVRDLNDGHIVLELNGQEFWPYRDTPVWAQQAPRLEQIIQQNYVRDLRQPSDALHYGWLNAETGYIKPRYMLTNESASESLKTLLPLWDQALAQFKTAKRLVIDVRFNPGGYDAVSLAYAATFTSERRVAMLKQTRDRQEYTPLRSLILEPRSAQPYAGPIILLTSRETVSAGETFAQAMRLLPKVTVVGERTAGFFSDMLPLKLPNGIRFGFSNERYFTPDGVLLEGRGVRADIEAPFDLELMQQGKDPALEWVLRQPRPAG